MIPGLRQKRKNHKFKAILNNKAGLPVWTTGDLVSARNETQSGKWNFRKLVSFPHQAGILPSPFWMFWDGFLFMLFSPLVGLDEVKDSCYTDCQIQVK